MPINPFIQLPPITADTPAEDVKQHILTELNRDFDQFAKFVNNYTVFTTAEYARSIQVDDKDRTVVRPNPYLPLVNIVLFSFFAAAPTYYYLHWPWVVSIGIYSIIIYFGYRMIPAFNRPVVIDRLGISIGKYRFEWSKIIGTYIVHLSSTGTIDELLLIDEEGEFHRIRINGYVPTRKLAAAVEYYRPGRLSNQEPRSGSLTT